MGEQISWRVELAVKPGELENFQALTGEMVEATREEPGTLSYERFASMVDRIRFTVFGNPSDELKGLLDGFGATYLRPFGNFKYWA